MDDDGFLPINFIAGFQRVQALTKDIDVILEVLLLLVLLYSRLALLPSVLVLQTLLKSYGFV